MGENAQFCISFFVYYGENVQMFAFLVAFGIFVSVIGFKICRASARFGLLKNQINNLKNDI